MDGVVYNNNDMLLSKYLTATKKRAELVFSTRSTVNP